MPEGFFPDSFNSAVEGTRFEDHRGSGSRVSWILIQKSSVIITCDSKIFSYSLIDPVSGRDFLAIKSNSGCRLTPDITQIAFAYFGSRKMLLPSAVKNRQVHRRCALAVS